MAAGFCPKNLAFARKIMVLPESGGCSPQPHGSYAYENCWTFTMRLRATVTHSVRLSIV